MKQLIGLLLLIGFLVAYWKLVLAIVVVVLIIRAAPVARREWHLERAAQQAQREELVARADRQHAQVMAGDERGVYGRYTPYRV